MSIGWGVFDSWWSKNRCIPLTRRVAQGYDSSALPCKLWFDKEIYLVNALYLGTVNIAISHILLKTRFFALHFCCRQYGSSCNHFDIVSFQMWRIQCNNAKQQSLRRSRSFKITNFATSRKLVCNFLLVSDTNLHPISHHFILHIICQIWGWVHIAQTRSSPWELNWWQHKVFLLTLSTA